jgi:hypothetical protein
MQLFRIPRTAVRAVFNELRTTAAVSQAPIEEVLDAADAEHELFWIANAIEVTSDDPELATSGEPSTLHPECQGGSGQAVTPPRRPARSASGWERTL